MKSALTKMVTAIACMFMLESAVALAQHIPANIPTLRAGISGIWYNPNQPAHAIQIEILDGARSIVSWYTYYSDGTPLWLFGEGHVSDIEVKADLVTFSGGRPPLHWHEANPEPHPWGSVTIQFPGCNEGILNWNSNHPDFGSGELHMLRYTSIQGTRCFAEEQFSMHLKYSFERRIQGFTAVFADLPADADPVFYAPDFRRVELPTPLQGYQGLRLTGNNHSDNLVMLVKAPIKGLVPDTIYRVEIDADIASNVPRDCAGAGGSPGDSVYIKLGAAGQEPLAQPNPDDNWLRLNIDFGQQSQGGANARVVGTLSNSQSCNNGQDPKWELKTVSTRGQVLLVTTDSDGDLWVFAGTDSGYEGLSQFYLTELRVRLEPQDPELP